MKIAQDVYWYAKDRPVTHVFGRGLTCNVYAIDQGDEIWLIDCGIKALNRVNYILREMKQDGLNTQNITKIFITHAHSDHINALDVFKKKFNVQIYVHENDADYVDGGYDFIMEEQINIAIKYSVLKTFLPVSRKYVKLFLRYVMGKMPREHPNVLLKGVESLKGSRYELKVLYTPGHTNGHCCYYLSHLKTLFSGDIVETFGEHKPSLNLVTANFENYLESMKKLSTLDIEVLCSSHGKSIHYGKNHNREIIEHGIENLLYAENLIINYLAKNNAQGIKIKDMQGILPKHVWRSNDQKSVPFAIIRALDRQGKIQHQEGKFFYIM